MSACSCKGGEKLTASCSSSTWLERAGSLSSLPPSAKSWKSRSLRYGMPTWFMPWRWMERVQHRWRPLPMQPACISKSRLLQENLQASIPFSPGMVDWSVCDGQPQIFQPAWRGRVDCKSYTHSCVMIPQKSLTMVMGIGANLKSSGRACDYCSMRDTCRYQDHYAIKHNGT